MSEVTKIAKVSSKRKKKNLTPCVEENVVVTEVVSPVLFPVPTSTAIDTIPIIPAVEVSHEAHVDEVTGLTSTEEEEQAADQRFDVTPADMTVDVVVERANDTIHAELSLTYFPRLTRAKGRSL